jgi:hypothetical protein
VGAWPQAAHIDVPEEERFVDGRIEPDDASRQGIIVFVKK